METLFFLLDAFAMTLLVFTSLQNDKHTHGERQIGLLGFREAKLEKPESEQETRRRTIQTADVMPTRDPLTGLTIKGSDNTDA